MKKIFFLLILLSLSGCAGLNLGQPERWVENNVVYSTMLPRIEVQVAPPVSFKKSENKDKLAENIDNSRRTGETSEWLYFADSSGDKRLNFKFQRLDGVNAFYIPVDYSQRKAVLVSSREKIGGIDFATGIFPEKIMESII